ncbi:MAG: Nitrilase [uncultured bacterium]|nr:MAG: Nitrilase [uncultured bacterium]
MTFSQARHTTKTREINGTETPHTVYKPFGDIVAGPMHREKGFLIAEIDITTVQAARRKFDATGHYARPDVFRLSVNRAAMRPVSFSD